MLYIVGLGLGNEKDITIRGLEAVKKCGKVYIEAYTSLLSFGLSSDGLSTLVLLPCAQYLILFIFFFQGPRFCFVLFFHIGFAFSSFFCAGKVIWEINHTSR
jgi:hypothetical protein